MIWQESLKAYDGLLVSIESQNAYRANLERLRGISKSHEVFFYITQYNSYWELIVKREQGTEETDIYRIDDGIITYDYSEKD